MDIIKASLMAAVSQGGGGSQSVDICTEIESLTTCGGGQLCTGYHYYLKQGRLAQSGKYSSWAVATGTDADPLLYEYEEARPLEFYVCVYDDDDNLMMIQQVLRGNGQYLTEYYARRVCTYLDGQYYVYADSEYITLGVGQASYSVSVNNTNVSLSITMSEGLQFTQYAYDGSIIDRSASTETRYIYCNIPDGSYGGGNKVYTPLSASDFSAFLADFVQAAYNDHNQ